MPDVHESLKGIKLKDGGHPDIGEGMSVMQFISYISGGPYSRSPECVCPIIADFVNGASLFMPQGGRDSLLPYIPELIGSRHAESRRPRLEYLIWRMIRVAIPRAVAPLIADSTMAYGGGYSIQRLKERLSLLQEAAPGDDVVSKVSGVSSAVLFMFDHYFRDQADKACSRGHIAARLFFTEDNPAAAFWAGAVFVYCSYGRVYDWAPLTDCIEGLLSIGPKDRRPSCLSEKRIYQARRIVGDPEAEIPLAEYV